jgi:hypothetical protein
LRSKVSYLFHRNSIKSKLFSLKLEQIRVRVGKWNVESKNEEVPYQDKGVSKIVIHEHYLDSTLYNDVALLVLNSSITKRDNVGTICLSRDVAILDSQNCLVTEWDNKSLQGKNNYTGVLKARQFSLISKKSCQKELRTKLGEEFVLHHSFICTNDGNGTCWVCQKEFFGAIYFFFNFFRVTVEVR